MYNLGELSRESDGAIYCCNQALAALLGSSLGQAMGSRLGDFVAPSDAERYSTLTKTALTAKVKDEICFLDVQGNEKSVLLSCGPLLLDELLGISAVVTDLSEQKRQAEKLLQRDGLAIVKKTMDSMGGAIRVESALGAGATFRFTWPR